jgi:hypothetical protein
MNEPEHRMGSTRTDLRLNDSTDVSTRTERLRR